ncbi:MAG: hypothetical protein GY940_00110, partial [bacterium]|nr:hypothetical protein [bacterium]
FMAFVVNVNPGFARVLDNGAGTGYDEDPPPDGAAANGNYRSIEDHIIQGAGFYLKASKNVMALLRMVELQNRQGVSIEELKKVTGNALVNINGALDAYNGLIEKAEVTPYNRVVADRLKALDYDRFRREKKLDRVVFGDVAGYLSSGDITGVFKRTRSGYVKIAALLNAVGARLDNDKLPVLKDLWKLNETFAESSLFGSYVARIFHFLTVKNKSKSSSLEVKNVR